MKSLVLGIDLGGTKVSAAVIDAEGNILGRGRAKTNAARGDEKVFETIAAVGNEALASAGVVSSDLAAVGIGSPGPLDPDTGSVVESANLGFKNFPLGPRLAQEFGCPVTLENDVSAGTYGEFRAGAARGAHNVLGMFVGTGIGGGVIVGGALYRGFNKNAGEIGHLVIRAGGPRCNCGNRGCLEAFASRTAMARQIEKAVKRGRKTMITKLADKKGGRISSGALKEAFDAKDKVVVEIVRRAANYIGIGIGGLVNVLSPEIVVLGGGVIEALGDDMLPRIERSARKIAFEYAMKDVKIVKAQLGDDAGVIGAATLAREALLRSEGEANAAVGG